MPARVTNFFFDKQHVIDLIGKANADRLGFAGAHIKRFAQTSMRYTKTKASAPGEPPRAHQQTGAFIRKRLFNWYDRSAKSMIVGSEKMGSSRASRNGVTLPELLEKGGMTTTTSRTFHRRSGGFVDWDKPIIGVRRQVYIAPRPYMGPALEHEIPLLPDRWLNSIKGP